MGSIRVYFNLQICRAPIEHRGILESGVRPYAWPPPVARELHQLDGIELREVEGPTKNRFVETNEKFAVDVVLNELLSVPLEVQRLKTVAQLVDREAGHVQRDLGGVPPLLSPSADAVDPGRRFNPARLLLRVSWSL